MVNWEGTAKSEGRKADTLDKKDLTAIFVGANLDECPGLSGQRRTSGSIIPRRPRID
jgi:hypothetical protein